MRVRFEPYLLPDVLRVEQSPVGPKTAGEYVCVTGGRDFTDLGFVWAHLDTTMHFHPFVEIGFGCAKGVDTLAWRWAEHNDIPWRRYVADWDRLGKGAGTLRNGVMLSDFQPDRLLVFPGGTGTTNCAKQARKMTIHRDFFGLEDDPFKEAERWG